MGAVVSRRMLLLAQESERHWPRKISLILFAPAHFGARAERLASQALLHLPLASALMPILKYRWPALDELSKGSDYLQTLYAEVKESLDAHPERTYLIAKRVVQSNDDRVIEKKGTRFCEDPLAEFIPGTHISMCKPTAQHRAPLEQLLAELK
jgi:hypothetical protein